MVVNQPVVLTHHADVLTHLADVTHHADVLPLDLHVVANRHHHVVVADVVCWATCSAADV